MYLHILSCTTSQNSNNLHSLKWVKFLCNLTSKGFPCKLVSKRNEMLFKTRSTVSKISRLYTHTKVASKKKSYTSTILLPQTKLPLRLEKNKLIERDVAVNNLPAFTELYDWQQKTRKGSVFVLHDGPPYANGAPHMGHTINKVLKDAIVRSKILQGRKVHYVPGWDCHGLPIELKAVADTKKNITPVEIRHKARNFAKQTIDEQKRVFQSWGVIGDWQEAYMTFNNSYIRNQMHQFYKLYEKKLVYRDVKPVYWSPSSRTALAEAELEYNEKHKSTAVIVKLRLCHVPEGVNIDKNSNVFALTWTTTPWSLPSNQAVCFNPDLSYSVVKKPEATQFFVVATNLIESLSKTLNYSLRIIDTFSGKLLTGAMYHHPITNETLPFLPAGHASETKGTGLVHTAPAHGPDDFLVALKNKLPILNLVNEMGCYTTEMHPDLQGLFVLSAGTRAVLDIIKDSVLHSEDYIHSYPYDWRTKQPVIIRASKQWFIDTEAIKSRAIELLEDVVVIPKTHSEIYKSSLITQLKKRPYWCISRQRSWGAPIPIFYELSTGEPIINKEILEHLCNLMDKHGSDYWWNLSLKELLPEHLNISTNNVEKGQDIFDIWFDSGLSWSNVLRENQIADIYLEGVDQFTGWFQSSLMTSVALRDKAPYKAVYVHGFAVDERGLKMSKSLGNVIDPQDIMKGKKGNKAYGIDALRWWVVCHANSDSIAHISTNVLQASADEVQKVRSVLRFALAALFDYKEPERPVDYSSLLVIDKYLLHLLYNFDKQVMELTKTYEFNKLSACVINFLTTPVSALYYLAIKDRLYCNSSDDSSRKAAQHVLLELFKIVTRSIAPIVPHLAEELYLHLPQKQEGSFFQNSNCASLNDIWCNPNIAGLVENTFLKIKGDIHKVVGANTLEVFVKIKVSEELFNNFRETKNNLRALSDELVDILQVSQVDIVEDKEIESGKHIIAIEKSNMHMCDRCRRVFAHANGELCDRCILVVNNFENKTISATYLNVFYLN